MEVSQSELLKKDLKINLDKTKTELRKEGSIILVLTIILRR